MGPLKGFTILEFAGIGPGPFAAMVLADLGARMMRSGRYRLTGVGIEDASLRHHELDRFEEPLVLGDLRIHHRCDLPDRVPAGVAERRPRLQFGPLV